MVSSAASAATAPVPVEALLLTLAGGGAAVILLLFALVGAAEFVGVGRPGLSLALDPAQPVSLAAWWGSAWLALAAGAALISGLRANDPAMLRLAGLPAILLIVETADLAARLEPVFGSLIGGPGTPIAKLAADAATAALVLLLVVRAAAARGPACHRCLAAVLAFGATSVAFDLAGRACASAPSGTPSGTLLVRLCETVEEASELGLYVVVAALVLGDVLRRGASR